MAKENAMANADNGPDNLVPPMPSGLREKYPNLERFWPFLQTLRRESPRGTVLTSCGFVEQQLKEILLAFMLDDTAVEEFIEGRNAPLGTLSSRISALGLITKDEYDDLTLMRRIRNDFAHQVETTFDTPSVVDRCKLLRHKAEDYGDLKVGSFGQFQSAAIGVIMSLTNRAFYVGRQRRKNEQWPY
jgi:mannitol operon repressor